MKKFVVSSFCAGVLAANVYASDVSVVGTIPMLVENNTQQEFQGNSQSTKPNMVLLQKVRLSDKAKKAMAQRVQIVKNKKINSAINNEEYPDQLMLGMNGTPVLNQGMHGSCVTFANSAALDALMGKGDYVSELCSLELGI